MKKIITFLCSIVLIASSFLACGSLLTDKFFKEDIGAIVIEEVNIKGHITDLFDQLESAFPGTDTTPLQEIKNNILTNETIEKEIALASTKMVEDIIYEQPRQDMKLTAKNIIFSYEPEMVEMLSPLFTQSQIEDVMNGLVDNIPLQEVYDIAVQSFKESLPKEYTQVLKIMGTLAQDSVKIGSIITLLASTILIILLQRKRFEWAFPIGSACTIAGIVFLIGGVVVPRVYASMLNKVNAPIQNVANIDFQLLTQFSIAFLFIGITCIGLHFKVARKYME